jgi:hypothetical protein
MADDADFIRKLEKETALLRKLQEEVGKAISRADDKIKALQGGASREDVFPRKKFAR